MSTINTITSKNDMGVISLQAYATQNSSVHEVQVGSNIVKMHSTVIIVTFKELYDLFIKKGKKIPHGGFRTVDETSPVYQTQYGSILDPESYGYHEGTYIHRQSGIAVNVKDIARIDSNFYQLEFSDQDSHGIFDGNHSFRAIMNACKYWFENNLEPRNEKVKLEIFVDLDPSILLEIVESRSSSVQLRPMSLAEGRKELDWIKQAIKEGEKKTQSFDADQLKFAVDDIGWEEGSSKPVTAISILRYLTALNLPIYSGITDENLDPIEPGLKARNKKKQKDKPFSVQAINAYDCRDNIFDKIYYQKYDGVEASLYFKNQADVLVDIVKLRDYIIVNAPSWAPDVKNPKNQNDYKTIYETGRNHQITKNSLLTFKPESENSNVLNDGYCLMILSALRPFFTLEGDVLNGKMKWRDGWDLSRLLTALDEGLGQQICLALKDRVVIVSKDKKNRKGVISDKQHKCLPRETTYDKTVWDHIAGTVREWYIKDLLRKQKDVKSEYVTSTNNPTAMTYKKLNTLNGVAGC